MAAAHDWWTLADTRSMLRLAFDGLCLVTAWIAGERCRMWSKRCKTRDRTIARLRAADQNRRSNARALPAAPKRIPPAPRTRLSWIWWPGSNTGRLPVPYGTERERLEADPCAPVRRPSPPWLQEWLATPELARYPMSVEQMTALYEPTRVWVVSDLPEPHLQEAN